MRIYRNSALGLAGMMAVASMALAAKPREETEEERKTPPSPPPPEKPKSLPGETGRQFAARMKAEGVK